MSLHKPVFSPLLTNQRRIVLSKDLSGGIRLEIEGSDLIVIPPEEAINFAKTIFELLGAKVNLNQQKKIVHA